MSMTLGELIARRDLYVQAEAKALARQEFSIEVDGGSRRYRYADLAEIRKAISDLNDEIARMQVKTNRTRRVLYMR